MNLTENHMADLQKLYNAVLNGDHKASVAVTQEALAAGADPMELITHYMIPAMDEVGRLFECEEYFVPELLLSGRAMKGSLELLRPLLAARGDVPAGRVVIGTVKGDLHDIGKNLVASMLEGGGFEVLDLGADVPPRKFIEAIRARNANIVCLSALLTVTMPAMRATVDALKHAGVREQVKIMVGGAPVTKQFADEIGADGYSANASAAVNLARTLIGAGKSPSYDLT
jgi:corrinoid protein of di/trimethylamine methyltransferase